MTGPQRLNGFSGRSPVDVCCDTGGCRTIPCSTQSATTSSGLDRKASGGQRDDRGPPHHLYPHRQARTPEEPCDGTASGSSLLVADRAEGEGTTQDLEHTGTHWRQATPSLWLHDQHGIDRACEPHDAPHARTPGAPDLRLLQRLGADTPAGRLFPGVLQHRPATSELVYAAARMCAHLARYDPTRVGALDAWDGGRYHRARLDLSGAADCQIRSILFQEYKRVITSSYLILS